MCRGRADLLPRSITRPARPQLKLELTEPQIPSLQLGLQLLDLERLLLENLEELFLLSILLLSEPGLRSELIFLTPEVGLELG